MSSLKFGIFVSRSLTLRTDSCFCRRLWDKISLVAGVKKKRLRANVPFCSGQRSTLRFCDDRRAHKQSFVFFALCFGHRHNLKKGSFKAKEKDTELFPFLFLILHSQKKKEKHSRVSSSHNELFTHNTFCFQQYQAHYHNESNTCCAETCTACKACLRFSSTLCSPACRGVLVSRGHVQWSSSLTDYCQS